MCEIEQINIRDVLENCKESKNKDLSSTCRIGSDLKICLSHKSTVDQFQTKKNLATC